MKKKLLIILVLALIVGAFFIGRQVGLNTEESKTKTVIKEETVSEQTIKKTLTASGQVTAKTTENLELDTDKYFSTMCVEVDDTVNAGENILEYTDGTFLTATYDCVILSINVPETEDECTDENYIQVSNLDTLIATISVNENEINDLQVGQEVEIVLSANESTYTGSITKIDSVGSYASSGTTFSATVEFENDDTIKLGMGVSCTIILEEATNVICVPIDAVLENSEGKEYVVKVNDDGTTEDVIIETGIADDSYVQVKSGLSLNDKVQIETEYTESTESSSENSSGFGSGRDSMKGGDFSSGEMPSGRSMGE